MFKLLKIIREVGRATVKYPAEPMDLPQGFRGKPEYKPEQCIACAACAIACPANALTMANDIENGTRTLQLFVGRCIYCGRCEEVCPTQAMKLSNMFETAVFNKADLYETGTFKLANCKVCGEAFAPQKEIDYAMALTVHAGASMEDVEARRDDYETCSACKRKQDLQRKNTVKLNQYLNVEGGE